MFNRYNDINELKTSKGIRYYKNTLLPEIPRTSDDIYVYTTSGDRLDLLSFKYYGDTGYYWILAAANPGLVRRDSLYLTPGKQIRIPQDIQTIISNFESINIVR
jgi:phage tail protein X